jgi:two-component sensor histidine kinase/CheY-like chemotaxis protein
MSPVDDPLSRRPVPTAPGNDGVGNDGVGNDGVGNDGVGNDGVGVDDDTIVLEDDGDDAPRGLSGGRSEPGTAWTVLVVDDEPDVHTVTRLALEGSRVDGSALRLLQARSGAQAREILQAEPECAVVLLDVVMETDDAGLSLARWIRESLQNQRVRIVLRTGQPGVAPEETVMSTYDIHDYYAKTEISARRLRTTVTSGVRAWRDLQTLHLQRQALERAQESIVRSLREKETLLKEIHHRVKNNLQIVSSLLRLQGEKMPSKEARDLIEESVLRVQSMALIHQHLYGVDSLDRVDLGDYARVLAESLRSLLAPSVRLRVDATSAAVAIHEAIPAGLILNELLTNAFKYGVPKTESPSARGAWGRAGPGCDVRVEIGRVDGRVRVAVVDSGPGLPANLDLQKVSSIGLHLIRLLTRQLRGTLAYDGDGGSRFVVSFLPSDIAASMPDTGSTG